MSKQAEKTSLAEQVSIDGTVYFYMPIDVAIKYADKIKSGFFVPLSETKRVRVEFGDEDLISKMESYREKGLANILFAEDDYYGFLKTIKHGLMSFFMKGDDAKVLNMTQMIFLVGKVIKYIGLDEKTIESGEVIANKVLNEVKTCPGLNNPLKVFQRENQDQFLKNLMVAYTCIGLIEALNWTTPQIKEKAVQICLFCDITLTAQNFMDMIVVDQDPSKFSKKILNHPLEAAKLVQKHRTTTAREVIQGIEQHHEKPDGSGYPQKIKGLAINQLSAIQIVARLFIDRLVASDFAYDDRKTFIDEMVTEFKFPNFSGPCKALYMIMGLEPEKQMLDY